MWPHLQETSDLVTFTEEIFNGKLYLSCSVTNCLNAFKFQCCHHIESSQLIWCANQLTGFYTRATLEFNGLIFIGNGTPSTAITTQKMKFSIKDFFSKCEQIHRKLRIWSHFLKKSLMENFIFCALNLIHFKYFLWFSEF